jgi:hypothetical protein
MATTRVGRIVHISRGYTVAEIVETGGGPVLGFSVFGYRSDTARLFPTPDAAIAELDDLANASAADARNSQRTRP